MKDHYQTLGVERGATDEDIKLAYRRLASQHHPDKGGDKERFQEIQQAYAVLSDPMQRQQYDNPGIRINMGANPHFNFDSIFDMFGARFQEQQRQRMATRMQLWIGLRDVAQGGRRAVSVATHQGQANIELDIPPGVEEGDSVRYQGLAPGGSDLIVTFRVRPEPGWHRQDDTVIQDVTVPIWDLILGTDITVHTLRDTDIVVTVPVNTQPGTALRIKGHGLRRRGTTSQGDMLVRLHAVLPDRISDDLRERIRQERGR